jgi:hypothetical protein
MPLRSKKNALARREILPRTEGRSMVFSARSDAENRSIAIGSYANLWTVERLELMEWTRAERSSL